MIHRFQNGKLSVKNLVILGFKEWLIGTSVKISVKSRLQNLPGYTFIFFHTRINEIYGKNTSFFFGKIIETENCDNLIRPAVVEFKNSPYST